MGRRRLRPGVDLDDKEKTLEPEKPAYSNPLARSATTHHLLNDKSSALGSSTSSGSSSTSKKERTPYRLHRNYSDRTTSGSTYKYRPELSVLHGNTSSTKPKTNYYDPTLTSSALTSSRHKDSLYDPYSSRMPNRYDYTANDYKHDYKSDYKPDYKSNYKNDYKNDYKSDYKNDYKSDYLNDYKSDYLVPSSSRNFARGKENTYKSKYDPSALYAELTSNDRPQPENRERDRKRTQKAYRRTATAHDTRHPTTFRDYNDDTLTASTSGLSSNDLPSSGVSSTSSSVNPSRYAQRRSLGGLQRSQTQKFFDSEDDSAYRSLNDYDANNNHVDYDDDMKTEAMKEREARRKEIQGLIMKYAQIDDVYNRATEKDAVNSNAGSSNVNSGILDYKPTNDVASRNHNALGLGLDLGPTPRTTATTNKQSLLPLAKTQSVASMSMARSRIPNPYSSLVRKKLNFMFLVVFVFSLFFRFHIHVQTRIILLKSYA